MAARTRDVVVQQRGWLVTSGCSIERRNSVTDVSLVLQQTRSSGAKALGSVGEGHDGQARPRDVTFPKLSHLIMERHLGGRA
jgi:hypothetical protein